jgi:hypothetical protein
MGAQALDTMKSSHKIVSVTVIFAVVEGAILYYLVALWDFVYTTGLGPPHYSYLPGVNYILETYFHAYWELPVIYNGNPKIFDTPQVVGGEHFMAAFQISMIVGSILTAILYFIKLKHLVRAKEHTLSSKS